MLQKRCYPELLNGRDQELCNYQNECKYLFRVCDLKTRKKLCTPLEQIYPEIYGKLDQVQLNLLSSNSLDVVLIENASEIVSQLKNIHGFIEQILSYISKDNKTKYGMVGSFTFPDIELKPKEELPEYEVEIKEIKTKINRSYKKKQNLIIHVGLEMGGVGHYGVIIKTGKDVLVFDSMQYGGKSSYTKFFSIIAKDIYGIEPRTPVEPTIRPACLQPTGGFVMPTDEKEPTPYWTRVQNMDSQNHFCYLWGIWYIHLVIVGGEEKADKVIKWLYENCIHPLVVIKRYIWSILHSFYPSDKQLEGLIKESLTHIASEKGDESKITDEQVQYITKFFLIHFRYVWDNLDKAMNFNRYCISSIQDLPKLRQISNINMCLEYSIQKVPYILDNFCSGVFIPIPIHYSKKAV